MSADLEPLPKSGSLELVADRVAQLAHMVNEINLIDEVLQIQAYAKTLEIALKATHRQREHSAELERSATALRLRAERRTGVLIGESQKRGEIAKVGQPKVSSSATRIKDLGLTWDESAQFAKLAKVEDDIFEVKLEEPRLSRGSVLRSQSGPQKGERDDSSDPYRGLPLDEAIELLVKQHYLVTHHLSEREQELLLQLVEEYRKYKRKDDY